MFSTVAEAAVRYTLILPIAMSILFACLFIYGAILNNTSRQELFSIRDALGFPVAPELAVLNWLLRIFAGLMLIVAVMLTALLLGCIRVACQIIRADRFIVHGGEQLKRDCELVFE